MIPDSLPGFSLAQIVASIGGKVVGDASVRVRQIAPLEGADAQAITFLANPRFLARLADCRAGAVIVGVRHVDRIPAGYAGNLIVADDAHVYFARVAQLLNPPDTAVPGIHPSATVETAIPASASVGPGTWVGAGAVIGERVVIGAHCQVGRGAIIGDDSRLHPGVSIYFDCRIGQRALIHSGTVIGSDGFGFAREKDGRWVKIPQIGRVIVGDDVEIGANCAIDRGAMEDTRIGDGVIIDNLVHVAHNVRIGNRTAIAACTGIAGSTIIGERCLLGGATMISGHLKICDDAVISGGSTVIGSINSPGVHTSSVPIMEHAGWLKNFSHLRHLDKMADKIRALEKRLQQLEDGTENPS